MDDLDGKVLFTDEVLPGSVRGRIIMDVHLVLKNFCEEIQKLEESKSFIRKRWHNNKDRFCLGIVDILENGDTFEKVAVCTATAKGVLTESTFLLMNKGSPVEDIPENPSYFTTGISGVVYPKNPHVPALNFSYRYFEMVSGNDITWWFSGGTDLVPYILNEEDCNHFHKVLKICCDKFDKRYYRIFKKSCDEHFYLEHRGERRGIGGIFFSELNTPNFEACFQFVSTCMKNIIPSYLPIVIKNKNKKYFAKDRDWQLLQRGRCVEFSCICDKATRLALMSSGIECESILACLPSLAKWQYNYIPEEKSKEYELVKILQNPIEWV